MKATFKGGASGRKPESPGAHSDGSRTPSAWDGDVTGVLRDLDARGMKFRTADGSLSTEGSRGKLAYPWRRLAVRARPHSGAHPCGLPVPKANDKVSGRRRKIAPADIVNAKTLLADGKLKVRDAAAGLGVSERTRFRELRAERDRKMVMPSKAPEMVS